MIDAVIHEVEAEHLVWRVSSAGVLAEGTRAEAMVKSPRGRLWHFGYSDTVEGALKDALAKYKRARMP